MTVRVKNVSYGSRYNLGYLLKIFYIKVIKQGKFFLHFIQVYLIIRHYFPHILE